MLADSLPGNIGRYEIKSLIGRGGMGDLYLARDPNTNRLVALKLLNASLHSGDLRERFAREARALAALNHPNIVTIYDYGEYQGSPFIVMEYVRGETLAEKIKRRAPLAIGQKLKLMSELCAGLAHAHEAGIIHRDIKPANLMVEQSDRLKILDFGIARVTEGSMTRVGQMTQLNMRIGTPGYMSPEQIEGNDLDHRSDLFAVGTVFYELLAYREAFTGGSTRQIENKVLEARPIPLESLVRDIDPEVVALVARALQKNPRDRFQDAAEFEQALEHQRWRLGPTKRTPSPPRLTPPPTPAPQGPGRGSRDARADAAYQRSMQVFQDGAEDAARRFAIEALAEDPNHLGARALLERLDPHPYISATQPFGQPSIEPTLVMAQPSSSPTVVQSHDAGAANLWKNVLPIWRRLRVPAAIAASVLVVAGLVYVIISASGWFTSSRSLTVNRPTGGTLLGRGITCGTLGSDCQANASSGEVIELQAQADPGYIFAGYTGDCANGRAIMTGARTCGATFNQVPNDAATKTTRVLTVTPAKGGTIVGLGITCGTLGSECTTSHLDGTQVKLDVLADQGFLFSRYTGACAPDGQTLMTEARSCSATFVQAGQAGNTQASGGGAGGSALPSRNRKQAPPPEVPGQLLPPPPPPTFASGNTGGAGGGASSGSGEAGVAGVAAPSGRATTNVPPIGVLVPKAADPTPPDVTAKEQIQDVLTQYCAAYDQLALESLRKIFPKAPNILRDQFRQYKTMQCTFAGPPEYKELDAIHGTARLQVDVKQAYDLRVGGEKTSNVTAVMILTRPEPRGPWFIEDAQIRPKK